jgi:hypothetical protein
VSAPRRRVSAPQLSLEQLKIECKKHGIKNTTDYKNRYRDFDGFPAHPERVYSDEWVSYIEFFDLNKLPTYKEVVAQIKPLGLKSQAEYKKFLKSQNNSPLPTNPQEAYAHEWVNWYQFLGKEEPFKTNFIPAEYSAWADSIDSFMSQARGGGGKSHRLCQFVRYFIQSYDKSPTPEAFLTQGKPNIKPFRQYLDSLDTDNMRASLIKSVNEYLDFVIQTNLTIEDESTGEIVLAMDARNPFTLLLTDQSIAAPQRTETVKPCLPYHFVRKLQNWVIKPESRNFTDLTHLQIFDADWVKVGAGLIDKTDPDCVYRKTGGHYYLWIPTDWIHVYALTKVPLRGAQIAYNDSGEADDLIADIDQSGKITWNKNTSPLAGLTKRQSFVKQLPGGELGMYVTTNKTANRGEGYTIPYLPEDLAYWLVRLRKWQQKYNPLTTPTSWLDCKRTNFNEQQRKARGINCFLFRAFGDIEAKSVSGTLSPRLAAGLYNIQPSDVPLAELKGNQAILSNFKSKFTPHSMRVSLITAYVTEMGMPIEIVMKIVGHSSVVMSIYYTKISNSEIRKRLQEGEKLALKSQAESTQQLIEQSKIESVKNTLVANSKDVLSSLSNDHPPGSYVFRDYGICPYAASRCSDGGELIGSSNVRSPAPSGYMGIQNCLRCRHFITGPAFLGGLVSIANEILLQANIQSETCSQLQEQIEHFEDQLNEIDRKEYLANIRGVEPPKSDRKTLEANTRQTEGDYESAAKKLDMLLCDIQAAYALIRQSQAAVNGLEHDKDAESIALIRQAEGEVRIEVDETSFFQQLNEVCENATIYQSASAENAILPRSQMLDRMALYNEISPAMFTLSHQEQLLAGNELCKLLRNRLKSWTRVDQVVNGEIKLNELVGAERITKTEIELIAKPALLLHKA